MPTAISRSNPRICWRGDSVTGSLLLSFFSLTVTDACPVTTATHQPHAQPPTPQPPMLSQPPQLCPRRAPQAPFRLGFRSLAFMFTFTAGARCSYTPLPQPPVTSFPPPRPRLSKRGPLSQHWILLYHTISPSISNQQINSHALYKTPLM